MLTSAASVSMPQPQSYDFADLLNGDRVDAASLRAWLLDARNHTRALTDDLEGAHELGPRLGIVNPPLWELGHIAWFQEYWCLRFRNGQAPRPSMIENADALYDSAIVAHGTRWDLPLLSWRDMRGYQDEVLRRVLETLAQAKLDEQRAYCALLCVFHEDMHAEALCYTRQTLGHARVDFASECTAHAAAAAGDAHFPGGRFTLGAVRGGGFVFDNERWASEVELAAFELARTPVSYAEFAAFVDADGYQREALWSAPGWTWRVAANARHPLYWRKRDGQWWLRDHAQWCALEERKTAPMMFVNWHEAQAYCSWVQRRLPTEAEWEHAARVAYSNECKPVISHESNSEDTAMTSISIGVRAVPSAPRADIGLRAGAVWEWTADWFAPYEGFAPGPYTEYSAPWFGDHKVLRGGCFATRARLLRPTYRNFYTPDRRDVFAGFRTAAL
jgi:gamma-glutamyl hercynylcysteine S-oxide synthase